MDEPVLSKILVRSIGSKKKPIFPSKRPLILGSEIDNISLVSL